MYKSKAKLNSGLQRIIFTFISNFGTERRLQEQQMLPQVYCIHLITILITYFLTQVTQYNNNKYAFSDEIIVQPHRSIPINRPVLSSFRSAHQVAKRNMQRYQFVFCSWYFFLRQFLLKLYFMLQSINFTSMN